MMCLLLDRLENRPPSECVVVRIENATEADVVSACKQRGLSDKDTARMLRIYEAVREQ
jgi:hypothetical protein